MTSTLIIVTTVFLLFSELLYFKIAKHFNIVDQPNHRSSHTGLTLRGGGVIFTVSMLLYAVYFGFNYGYFLLGLVVIAFISFMDDIKPVSNKLRIIFHLIGVALLFYQLDLFSLPFYWIVFALVFVIGTINAINFMDGINGITGSYALVALCTLLYIDILVVEFVVPSMIITSIISVVVFNFFNFRKKAMCFAGDVGSVGIAFIILFFLLSLVIKTENLGYLLLLLIYGLDTAVTVFFRLIRKENIFDAHRSHFYQYLVNERKIPHLIVSIAYGLVQLIINASIIYFMPQSVFILCLFLFFSTGIFVVIRFWIEGSSKLLGR